ncbi:MAG: hypothetical protein ACYCUI_16985 [Vulcanimicrobiaceae bacterium]
MTGSFGRGSHAFNTTHFRDVAGLVALAAATPGFARGDGHDIRFETRHARRDQMLDRMQLQNHRITQQVREGELNHAQAHALRRTDARIAGREQALARRNGGYITKKHQAHLNRRLNDNSKRIRH